MKKNSLRKKFLTKKRVIILLVIFSAFLIAYKVRHDIFFLEGYCEKQANQIVGKNWGKKIPATDFDRQRWPSVIQADGAIFAGVHEVIKCEDQHKAFVFF